ncbi:MAG: ferritin [Prevotellaceae bacterium]|jgi:ferritin|nr:ferritin [Prevotellaceae bacterium]
MISEKLQKAINTQITAEMWSANLYLSMSFFFSKEGYDGFAHWMKVQYEEEMEHACKLANYLVEREGTPLVDKIDVVPQGWGSPLEVFEATLSHEKKVSKMINELVAIAEDEKDYSTTDFLSWFIAEQVEEEATALNIVKRLKLAGDCGTYNVNNELGARK